MPLPARVSDLVPFELLLSVARLGSVGAAAQEHGISQPSASSRLRHLERRLGVQLLDRTPRGSRLTENGSLVADWAREVLDAAADLEAGIASLSPEESRMTVAASMTVAEYLLPHWLALLHGTGSATAVALETGNSDDVTDRVLRGAAGLGFIEGPDVPPGITAATVARDRLTVVVHPDHPWAARRASGISVRELAGTPLISREYGSGTRRYLERALAGRSLPVAAPLLELSSTTAIKSAVAEGIAPAVLSSLAISREVAGETVVPVPVDGLDLTRELRVIHRTGRQLMGTARTLADIAAAHGRMTA